MVQHQLTSYSILRQQNGKLRLLESITLVHGTSWLELQLMDIELEDRGQGSTTGPTIRFVGQFSSLNWDGYNGWT